MSTADEASVREAKRPFLFFVFYPQVQMTTDRTLSTMELSCTTESLHKQVGDKAIKSTPKLARSNDIVYLKNKAEKITT